MNLPDAHQLLDDKVALGLFWVFVRINLAAGHLELVKPHRRQLCRNPFFEVSNDLFLSLDLVKLVLESAIFDGGSRFVP